MDTQDKESLLLMLKELKDVCGDIRGSDGYYLDGRVSLIEDAVRRLKPSEQE